jgi:hypothetical protein
MKVPVRGRRPGRAQRDELLRIWDAVGDDGRKMLLFLGRQLAREQGLVSCDEPLLITDRVF